MLSRPFSSQVLRLAAIFFALAIPMLFLGRAALGISLGLSFLMSLYAGHYKDNWVFIRPYLTPNLIWFLGGLLTLTFANVPFSLDAFRSLEAWGRSWALLFAVAFVVISLREHLRLILIVLSISFLCLFVAYFLSIIHINKTVLNGYLLALPVIAYASWRYLHKSVFVIILSMFVAICILEQAKASLAGTIIMGIAVLCLYAFRRFSKIKALFICVTGFVCCGVLVWYLGYLLINHSSLFYEEYAYFPVFLVDIHRQFIWEFALGLWRESPVFGLGFNASNFHPLAGQTVGEYTGLGERLEEFSQAHIYPGHPHNWFLEILVEGGVVAALPMAIGVMVGFWLSLSKYFKTYSVGLIVLLSINLAYWGTGLLNFSFWSVWWQVIYFMMNALAILMIRNEKNVH